MENEIQIDNKKIKRMIMKILLEERKNSRTKEYNDSEMVSKIQKIIEGEIECV